MLNWEQEVSAIICPHCKNQSWGKISQHNKRYNSITATVSCYYCRHTLFLKKINITHQVNNSNHEAKEQFDTLLKVYKQFPSTEGFSTLVPVHLNQDNGWFATKFVLASTLDNWLINNKSSNIKNTIYLTGKWLRLLHQAGSNTEIPNSIIKKQHVIQQKWSKYTPPTSVSKSITSLNKASALLRTKKLTGYWLHGDFTPNNILVDKQRLTGIDIGWRSQGIAEMDLAPFLNHLYFVSNKFRGRHLKKIIPDLESTFLSGYFDSTEHDPLLLNWCRLYFLLSYWASGYNSFLKRAYSKFEFDSITKEITKKLDLYIQ